MIITYKRDFANVDWEEMKATLSQDKFDNGRSSEQLRASFANSYATCIAYAGDRIIGTARVLSDGICNAYIVDVWTFTPYRHQGIASTMMQTLLAELPGQHVCLFTDDAIDFYKKLGFLKKIGLTQVSHSSHLVGCVRLDKLVMSNKFLHSSAPY